MPAFLVIGATGRQGGSVAHALLSSGHEVHALVRDQSSNTSQGLQKSGATLFTGCFTDIPSITTAAKGCEGVFINVLPNPSSLSVEIDAAKSIIDGSLSAGVKTCVYSSFIFCGRHEEMPGWDAEAAIANYYLSKHAIEEEVKRSSFENWTILRPGYFMSNFSGRMGEFMYPELSGKGVFRSGYKAETKLPLLHPGDIGAVAAKVLEEPGKWRGRQVDLVGEDMSVRDLMGLLGEVSGKRVELGSELEDGELEGNTIRQWVVARERMEVRCDELGCFRPDYSALREMGVRMRGWREFLKEQKDAGELEEGIGAKRDNARARV